MFVNDWSLVPAKPGCVAVACAAMIRQGQVLLQQRGGNDALTGLWEFPGGKLDAGESAREALVRELMEELGIAVRVGHPRPLHAVDDPAGRLRLMAYRLTRWEGVPAPQLGQPLQWVALRDLPHIAMPPLDQPIVDCLLQERD